MRLFITNENFPKKFIGYKYIAQDQSANIDNFVVVEVLKKRVNNSGKELINSKIHFIAAEPSL